MSAGQLVKILKDNNNEPLALDQLLEGETFDNTVSTAGVMAFKDSSGNAIAPQLNPEGALPVTFDAGTTKRNSAKLVKASQTKDIEAEVVAVDLVADKTYNKLSAQVSCFRASFFRVCYVDDYGVTDTITELGYALVDAGNVTQKISLEIDEFSTAGGTGVQKLVVFHTPLDQTSDAYASASCNEIA